jgi:pimeloyl-ACP methyl ester carboxylesterase
MTDAGLVLIRMNFSHNGTTPEQPNAFADLEAFGQNNLTIELDDLGTVLDYLQSPGTILPDGIGDPERIYLIGHSRGGGITILRAATDERVKKLVTWAAVSDYEGRYSASILEKWAQEGVIYIKNARTGQDMPLYYQSVENFRRHKERLSIPMKAQQITQPWLIIHGQEDESVPVQEAKQLHQWNPKSELYLVQNAGHTFGGYEPFDLEQMPPAAQEVANKTIAFFRANTD